LTEAQLREYFLFIKNEKRFSVAALKIAFSGIKFFYTGRDARSGRRPQ
jgi:hypothetical protein